jgi:hydroxymethylbilane synthase
MSSKDTEKIATQAPLVLLTRGSELALWQARKVAALLDEAGIKAEICIVKTKGDKDRSTPLAAMGGTGLFTKALQVELLEGRGDLAVHSLKDLPSATVEGLELAAALLRYAPEDVLVTKSGCSLEELPEAARVGSGSPRRRALLRARRPARKLEELRGNLGTRRDRVLKGELDGAILARAGLERLGWMDKHCHILDPSWMVPAPCQGILGIECVADSPAARLVRRLNDVEVRRQADAERSFMRVLGAGCTTPVGALARDAGGELRLVAWLAAGEHGPYLEAEASGKDPEELGARVARELQGLLS